MDKQQNDVNVKHLNSELRRALLGAEASDQYDREVIRQILTNEAELEFAGIKKTPGSAWVN